MLDYWFCGGLSIDDYRWPNGGPIPPLAPDKHWLEKYYYHFNEDFSYPLDYKMDKSWLVISLFFETRRDDYSWITVEHKFDTKRNK